LPSRVNESVNGQPLRITGRRYSRGFGTTSGARVTYFIGGGYELFSGEIGIDDETQGKGSVVFEIHGDDELLFRSDVCRGGEPPRRFNVSVEERRLLTLTVADAGDGTEYDHADWGDAYLRAVRRTASTDRRESRGQQDGRAGASLAPRTRPAGSANVTLPRVLIDTSLGEIVVELDADKTPVTVQNFLQYVDDRFYDNTIFHRVVKAFVIQGGGYAADLTAKPTREPIRNEARQGGSNTRGTVVMARGARPDSATSQFYINLADNRLLDSYGGGYCVFGRVTRGMDVVDRIAGVPTENRSPQLQNLPVEPVFIRSIRRQ